MTISTSDRSLSFSIEVFPSLCSMVMEQAVMKFFLAGEVSIF